MTPEKRRGLRDAIVKLIIICFISGIVSLIAIRWQHERRIQQYEAQLKETWRVGFWAMSHAGLDREYGVGRPLSMEDFAPTQDGFELRISSQEKSLQAEDARVVKIKTLYDVEKYMNVYNYCFAQKSMQAAPIQGDVMPNN